MKTHWKGTLGRGFVRTSSRVLSAKVCGQIKQTQTHIRLSWLLNFSQDTRSLIVRNHFCPASCPATHNMQYSGHTTEDKMKRRQRMVSRYSVFNDEAITGELRDLSQEGKPEIILPKENSSTVGNRDTRVPPLCNSVWGRHGGLFTDL